METTPEPPARTGPSEVQSGPAAAAPGFVGRARQLGLLGEALAAVDGEPVVRVVDGVSGMGKSTLVHHFLERAAAADPRVVTFAGRSLEHAAVGSRGVDGLAAAIARFLSAQPMAVRGAVLPAHMCSLVRLFPVLADVAAPWQRGSALVDPGEERRRGFGALRDLLVRLGRRRSIVLFLDDAQWADADTAALLAELLRPPNAPGILLILACRRADLSRAPALARLLELARDERAPLDIGFVHVDELSGSEARSLARQRLPEDGPLERVVSEANGSPVFIDQLARRPLRSARAISLDTLIRERVAEQPAAARRLLEALMVAGSPVRASVVASAAQEPDARRTFSMLSDAGLAAPGPTPSLVEPWHDRVSVAILAGLEPEALRDWHLGLGRAHAAEPSPDAEAVARHLLAASESTAVADWCVRAGAAAMEVLAFDRASRHYAAALERGADPWTVRLAQADALAAAGRGAAAARVRLAAAEHAPVVVAQALRADASLQLLLQGHVNEGMDLLRDALRGIGIAVPATPWAALFSVFWRRAWLELRGLGFRPRAAADIAPLDLVRVDTCWSAAVGLATFDQVRSADFQARELLLALQVGEPLRVARALSFEMLHPAVAGSRGEARARRIVAHAAPLVEAVDDPLTSANFELNRGIAAFLCGRFTEARDRMERADEALRTRCAGGSWERDNLSRFYLRVLALRGDLRLLVAHARSLIHDAEARGDVHISLHARLRTVHLARLAADEPEGLEAELDEMVSGVSRPGFHFQHFVHLHSRCEVDLYTGNAVSAWNRVTTTWPAVVQAMLLRVQATRVEGAYLRGRCALAALAALDGGDSRRATVAGLAADESRRLRAERVPWATALAALLDATHAAVDGHRDAGARLGEAASALDAVDMSLHAACARITAAGFGGHGAPEAEAWLRDEGIVDAPRFARVFVPVRP